MSTGSRFVILAAPRTGSNLLCTLLNSHPEVLCHHELFNPHGIFYALECRDGSLNLGDMEARDRDPFRFLQRVWDSARGASCVGFKMTRGQHEEVMHGLIGDSDVRKILLHRRNRLKTYVSEQIAMRTDRWEVYSRKDLATDVPRINVDIESFMAHCDQNERFYRSIETALRSGEQPWIRTFYEGLHDVDEHIRLLEFIGVQATQTRLTDASIKQSDRDLRSHIQNFRELERRFRGTEYLAELHDDEN